jgi:membrane protein required for colicin V production
MNWIDLVIIAVILISVISAFAKGLLVELFSLAGIIVGLIVAASDYGQFALWLNRWIREIAVADLVAFLLIALGIMVVASLLGHLLSRTVHVIGLGFLDRLLGAVFGFLKGCLVVTLMLMGVAAFLPRSQWLRGSKLAPYFLTAAHDGSHITPFVK